MINPKLFFVISIILIFSIAGCVAAPVQSTPNLLSSSPTILLKTVTPASTTLYPTETPTFKLTTTSSPKPKNPILVSHINYSGGEVDQITACLWGNDFYDFVLYQNGHLIIFDGTYRETIVPQPEIDKLLGAIEATGFFSIYGNGDQYIKNAPTPPYIGRESNITVNGNSIYLNADMIDYEIEAIRKTQQLIGEFDAVNLQPYKPESVTIWAIKITDTSFDSYYPRPQPNTLHWSSDTISLEILANEYPSKIINSGKALDFLMSQIKTIPDYRMIDRDSQYYLVLTCPNF